MPTTERMEITEYLDGNGRYALSLKYPVVELRGVWEDRDRLFAGSCRVLVRCVVTSTSLQLASHTTWPVGARNVKVTYLADVPVEIETCEICGGEGVVGCSACQGSGEGMHEGTTCRTCKGEGEFPCECQDERLRDEEDERQAAMEDKYDARKDGE